jgi:DNA integrity scanning protein DisA with diadenylate cyclase activity
MMEVASIDGAVIFDANNVLAIGAVIETHEDVGSQAGARSTAALSAYHWGGRPVKVSSDGEISVYFASTEGEADSPVRIEFL